MSTGSPHIIHSMSIELTATATSDRQWDMVAEDLLKKQLLPLIEKLFDEIATTDVSIHMDLLELNLGQLSIGDWRNDVMRQVRKQLPQQIQRALDDGNAQHSDSSPEKVFRYFLLHGVLPWWSLAPPDAPDSWLESEIRALLVRDASWGRALLQSLSGSGLVRLVKQYDDTFLELFVQDAPHQQRLKQLYPLLTGAFARYHRQGRNAYWKTLLQQVSALPSWSNDEVIDLFIPAFVTELNSATGRSALELASRLNGYLSKQAGTKPGAEVLTQVLDALKSHRSTPQEPEATNNKAPETAEETAFEEDGYIIDNAGLIILHPFITGFFESMGYTKDRQFVDRASQAQAALVLQYLLQPAQQYAEHKLRLNKLLCGIEMREPLEGQLAFRQEIQEESEKLLTSVIKNWPALKNTSPDGLRGAFLLREGKLSRKPDGDWELLIQYKTEDILLGGLQWSISIIKLPWMPNKLWVKWA